MIRAHPLTPTQLKALDSQRNIAVTASADGQPQDGSSEEETPAEAVPAEEAVGDDN